jgi:hypothetical protein
MKFRLLKVKLSKHACVQSSCKLSKINWSTNSWTIKTLFKIDVQLKHLALKRLPLLGYRSTLFKVKEVYLSVNLLSMTTKKHRLNNLEVWTRLLCQDKIVSNTRATTKQKRNLSRNQNALCPVLNLALINFVCGHCVLFPFLRAEASFVLNHTETVRLPHTTLSRQLSRLITYVLLTLITPKSPSEQSDQSIDNRPDLSKMQAQEAYGTAWKDILPTCHTGTKRPHNRNMVCTVCDIQGEVRTAGHVIA